MNGIHDLGGMHGFGPIVVEANEPVFHARWHGRVHAMVNLALSRGIANVDAFRHAIERIEPTTYLTAGYYGRWLAALETLLAERDLISREEIEARADGQAHTTPASPPLAPVTRTRSGSLRSIEAAPRFAVGAMVRARNLNPRGHTRLPRYVRGKCGVVARVHPAWVFPDTNAHGLGEHPQHVYAVRFSAAELWGPDAEPNTVAYVDLFESYLESVAAA